MYNIEELEDRLLSELKEIAEQLGINNVKKLQKKELIYKILDQQAITPENKLPEKKQIMNTDKPEEDSLKDPKNNDANRRKPRVKRENVKDSEPDNNDFTINTDFSFDPFSTSKDDSFSFAPETVTTTPPVETVLREERELPREDRELPREDREIQRSNNNRRPSNTVPIKEFD
jgi:transcription termination factor Rho